ncbi:HEPN domain-containing protein [Streptococcus suis]|nr:HEPN domain-containing protein [Streptococcus suis]
MLRRDINGVKNYQPNWKVKFMQQRSINEEDFLVPYDEYLEIYQNILPKLEDEKAKTLLENSLYLSIFTTFELFLKKIIDVYIANVLKKGLKFEQLVDEFAIEYLKNKEEQIKYFFSEKNKNTESSFSNIKKLLYKDLEQKEITNYVRFEYLHKTKLEKYYPALFKQILGEEEFLDRLSLEFQTEDLPNLEFKSVQNAKDFIHFYTDKIRNNIAHQNSTFSVGGDSFEDCVNHFKEITQEIYKKFIEYNELGRTDDLDLRKNVLDIVQE